MTPGIGYCGLDRTRRPLAGDEIRGCWTGRPAAVAATPIPGPPSVPAARLRGFVPLDALAIGGDSIDPSAAAPIPPSAVREPIERATLFDVDP